MCIYILLLKSFSATYICFGFLLQRENRLRNTHLITSNRSEALLKAWNMTNFSRHLATDCSAAMNYFNTNKKVRATNIEILINTHL